MSVDIYPATQTGQLIEHADNWDEGSTLNLTNGNFWSLMDELKLGHLVTDVPANIRLKTLEVALSTAPHTRYTARLKQICAVARIKRAPLIAFT